MKIFFMREVYNKKLIFLFSQKVFYLQKLFLIKNNTNQDRKLNMKLKIIINKINMCKFVL